MFITIILSLCGLPGAILNLCIIAPIFEENAKMIAIKGGFAKEFTIVFNTYEFTSYVKSIVLQGESLGVAIVLRTVVIGMHVTTTIIQYLKSNKQILDKIDSPEADDNLKAQMTGHIIGVLIHSAWNSMAVVSALAK